MLVPACYGRTVAGSGVLPPHDAPKPVPVPPPVPRVPVSARVEVLVVDAAADVRAGFVALLEPLGCGVLATGDAEAALALAEAKGVRVAIVDVDTPATGEGIALIAALAAQTPPVVVFALVTQPSFDLAVQAVRAGACDVVVKAPDQVQYLRGRIAPLCSVGAVVAGPLATAGAPAAAPVDAGLDADLRRHLDELLRALMAADRRAIVTDERYAVGDRGTAGGTARVLCASADDRLFKGLSSPGAMPGFTFELAQSAGAALDRVTNQGFSIVLVGPDLPDMPSAMLVRAVREQEPDLAVLVYAPGGRVELIESSRSVLLIEKLGAASQLAERLIELAEAQRVRAQERRTLRLFRERHEELLRRFAEFRRRLDARAK